MKVVSIVLVALLGSQMLATMIGNVCLIILLRKSRQLHRRGSMNLIFNCATVDLTSAMINIPISMDYYVFKTGNLNGAVATSGVLFTVEFLTTLTLHSTLLVAIDRFWIVKYPIKYNDKMTVKKARVASVLMWLFTFLLTGIANAVKITVNPPRDGDSPVEYMVRDLQSEGKFKVFFSVCAVLLSLCVLTKKLYGQLQNLLKNNTENTLKSRARRRTITASSKTALIVMGIYIVSFCPILLECIFRFFDVTIPFDDSLRGLILFFLAQMSSLLNPYVFIVRSSTLRQGAIKIVRKRRRTIVGPIEDKVAEQLETNKLKKTEP